MVFVESPVDVLIGVVTVALSSIVERVDTVVDCVIECDVSISVFDVGEIPVVDSGSLLTTASVVAEFVGNSCSGRTVPTSDDAICVLGSVISGKTTV